MSIRRKSLVVARLLIAVPIVFSLMGSTGKSTVFSCGGEMLEVLGPCDVDGGVNCSTDGGSPVKGGPISDDPPNGTNARLQLTVLPSTTVAPGHGRLLRASVIGTPAQVQAVQEMYWVVSKHPGTVLRSECPDGMSGSDESCLGKLDIEGSSSTRPILGSPDFYVPYEAYADPAVMDCEDQPSKGLYIDITAFTKGIDGLVSLASSATIHIGCPDFSITPSELSMAPGGKTQAFSAVHADGSAASVIWSVQTLDGSLSSAGGTIDPFGLYRTPQLIPTKVPVVLVTATSTFDLSVAEGAFVYLQPQPVEVNITSTTTVFTPTSPSTPYTFHAQVRNLNYLIHGNEVRWSLNKGSASGVVPNPSHISLNEETGVLNVYSVSSGESGAYVVTATSQADKTKSDHLTIYIYDTSPTATIAINDEDAPETLTAGQTYTFSALVENDPAGDTSVEWSATCPGCSGTPGTSSINVSTGVFTARPVGGTALETWNITATHGSASATTTINVDGPVWVTIDQAATTVAPGDTVGPFSAFVHKSGVSGVTWTSNVTSSSLATFDPVAKVLSIGPTSVATSYTVTATSVVDPSKSASVVITVGSDPNGLAGTISYAGTKNGTVYVECQDASGDEKSGTVALVDFPENSAAQPVPFRIHGGSCSGGSTVKAWMDTLEVGRFVFGADPVGEATVPASGSRTVTLVMQDYSAAVPPTTGMTGPGITGVLQEAGGAVVFYSPFKQSSTHREFAHEYQIFYTRQTTSTDTIDTSIAPLIVKPGTFGTAFVPIASSGKYCFAMRAKFTSIGGTEHTYPSSLAPQECKTFPVSSGASIFGSVNRTALTVPATSAKLHALAFNSSNAPVYAGKGSMSSTLATTDYEIVGVTTDGTYGLRFLGDLNGNGYLDPTDFFGSLFAPLKFLEFGLAPAYAATATVSAGGDEVLSPAYVLSNAKATASVFTDVSIAGSTVEKITYVVQAGIKPVVQVTRLSGPAWESDANRDIYCADHLATSQEFRRNTFIGTTTLLETLSEADKPARTDTAKLRVKYADGTSEDLTVTVGDLLKDPAVDVDETGGGAAVLPAFSWTNPTNPGNTIDHYTLTITKVGSSTGTTFHIAGPSAVNFTLPSGSALEHNQDYTYTFTAIDVAGDRLTATGSFHTVL